MDVRNIEQHEEDKLIANLERAYREEIQEAEAYLKRMGKRFRTQSVGGFQLIIIIGVDGTPCHTWANTIQYIEEITG